MCGILASDSTIFSLILLFENVTHCRTEFLISLALELPCVLTTSLLSPLRGAPQYSDAVSYTHLDVYKRQPVASPPPPTGTSM